MPPEAAKLKILVAPKFRRSTANPYQRLLYGPMEESGWQVEEFRYWRCLSQKWDIIHIHWPEHMGRGPLAVIAWAVIQMKRTLSGACVVWTAHNQRPHQSGFLGNLVFDLTVRNIDGWISLARCEHSNLVADMPWLKQIPCLMSRHGHYKDVYPLAQNRERARALLGIDSSAPTVLFTGNISSYKGLPELMAAFAQWPNPAARLIIAGSGRKSMLEEVQALSEKDSRITFFPSYQSEEQLAVLYGAADFCVLPYRKILNSASALLSLSLNTPVLCPRMGALVDLERELGADWMMLYDGEISADKLAAAAEQVRLNERLQPDLSAYDWSPIAGETMEFFRRLRDHGPDRH